MATRSNYASLKRGDVELNVDKDGATMRGRELWRNREEAWVQQIRLQVWSSMEGFSEWI